jgi:GGDEF domain-containing protein
MGDCSQRVAARLGGDEFGVALLLPPAVAVREVLTLREILAQPVACDGQLLRDLAGQIVRPAVSIGIARAAGLPDGAGASRILRGADTAMYRVKTGQEPPGYVASRQDAYAPAVHGRRPGTAIGVPA